MFNRSRRNLARWFTLSMGSILILFATTLYYLRAEDKLKALDQLLYKKTRIMAASVQYELRQDQPQVDLNNVPLLGNSLQPLDTELVYVRWYNAQGQLKRFFGAPPSEQLSASPGFLSLNDPAPTDRWLRQVTLPVQEGNRLLGYLQIAVPLTDTQADLRQFQLVLTLTVPIALILIGFTGWQLGGLAMQPIRQAYMQLQRFTADASHELRSPLSAILTNAQVGMLLAKDAPEIQPSLENIIDSSKSINSLVSNLLLLARHSGRIASELLKPVILNNLLEELAADYTAEVAKHDIKLVTHLPKHPIELRADLELLRQAVKNLLSNACKYTPAGGTV